MDEQRARELASIEPPSSIGKIVDFTERLSFGQDALFAGTDLPKPAIGGAGMASQELARQMSTKPYSLFPGAGGEGLDTVMSRHTIRTRDIQDFTRWLMKWEDKRSSLLAYRGPEQIFLQRPDPASIEAFAADPDVQRAVVEGRRRSRLVEQELHEIETEERVVKVKKTKQIQEVEETVEEPAPPKRRKFGGHPKAAEAEPDYGEYWREQPKSGLTKAKAVAGAGGMASAAAAAPLSPGSMLATLNRGVLTSNLSLGSLSTGVIQGRADAAASFQAQQAAASAVQTSPVAPYMQQPPSPSFYGGPQAPSPYYQQAPPGQAFVEQRAMSTHFPQPEVSLQSRPAGPPPDVHTDWPGAPEFKGKKPPEPQIFDTPDDDYVVVSKKRAADLGVAPVSSPPPPRARRAVATALAAGFLFPTAFASASPAAAPAIPGIRGLATESFAQHIGARVTPGAQGEASYLATPEGYVYMEPASRAAGPGGAAAASYSFAHLVASRSAGPGPMIHSLPDTRTPGSAMPAGSYERGDLFARGFGVAGPTAFRGPMAPGGIGSMEPPVRTPIPANPLMGQITLVSGPMHVASRESEQAGSAVSFDVKTLAKGAGTVDAAGLAMLRASLPPGAQAIYPALPQGSLGHQAVNLKLAPSLLGEILTQGYGPKAASELAGPVSRLAPQMTAAHGVPSMEGKLVPTAARPTDAMAGVLGHAEGAGALEQAGGAGAQRGGALDFLGMPVRLAPSLAGNPQIRQEAEAQKVLPGGAAAILRPNQFGSVRSKLFSGFGAVEAEPDKGAWRKAAPSFGMPNAEPETILSSTARLKPPAPGAPIPQIEDGGHTPAAAALSHAMGVGASMAAPGLGLAGEPGLPIPTPVHPSPMSHAFGHAPIAGALGGALGATSGVPGLGLGLATGAALGTMQFGNRSPFSPGIGGTVAPAPASALRAAPGIGVAAKSPFTPRVSRFTPPAPSIGLGPTGITHTASTPTPEPHTPSAAASAASRTVTPRIPTVLGNPNPAIPDITSSSPSIPHMVTPARSIAGGGRPELRPLRAPVIEESASRPVGAVGPSASVASSHATSSFKLPEMPIAASIPAKPPKGSSMAIQRSNTGSQVASPSTSRSGETQHQSEVNTPQDPGAMASEVNLVANEVWSILRKKLAFEAERLGKRF